MKTESPFDPKREKYLFVHLRKLELREYRYLVQKKVLKGKPADWLQKDADRKLTSEYLGRTGDPKLLELAELTCTLRQQIVEANMGWVVKRAGSFYSSFLSTKELIQEGVIGLTRAMNRFDLAKGFRFATYARHWIDTTIRRAVYEHDTDVKNTQRVREQYPNFTMLALEDVDPRRYSTDQGDHIMLDWDKVQKALKTLSARDQLILEERFKGDGTTLREIGLRWGVSRERIRQIQNLSLEVLRDQLGV